jgi:hypothetical protein
VLSIEINITMQTPGSILGKRFAFDNLTLPLVKRTCQVIETIEKATAERLLDQAHFDR